MVTNLSNIFAALADPTRLDMLLRIAPQRLTVGEIARKYEVSQPAVTKQLNVLEHAGLIKRERRGRQQVISPVPAALSEATTFMDKYEQLLNGRLGAIETYLQNKSTSVVKIAKTIPQPDHTMTLTQHINYPRSEVWAAYTNAEEIPHWWTPPGSTLVDCKVEVRTGGAWRFTVKAPNGQIKVVSGIFKDVQPEHKLVYTDGFDDPRAARAESLITVTFNDAPHGGTILTKEVASNPQVQRLQEEYIETVNN